MISKLEEIIQVDFFGTIYAIEAVLPEMLSRASGQIVGIASLAAVRAIPFESAYCASKAALAIYLESLRPPLRRRGVRVTTIFPGFVRTPLLQNLLAESGASPPPACSSRRKRCQDHRCRHPSRQPSVVFPHAARAGRAAHHSAGSRLDS